MIHDRRPPEEAREWLEFAEDDLRAGKKLLQEEDMPLRHGLYHAQQAAEKALKAFLIASDLPYPLTHNLESLRSLCCAIDPQLDQAAAQCTDLTQFVALTRYPGDERQPSRSEANSWVDAVTALLAAVTDRLRVR